jgi:hypothetical protein
VKIILYFITHNIFQPLVIIRVRHICYVNINNICTSFIHCKFLFFIGGSNSGVCYFVKASFTNQDSGFKTQYFKICCSEYLVTVATLPWS